MNLPGSAPYAKHLEPRRAYCGGRALPRACAFQPRGELLEAGEDAGEARALPLCAGAVGPCAGEYRAVALWPRLGDGADAMNDTGGRHGPAERTRRRRLGTGRGRVAGGRERSRGPDAHGVHEAPHGGEGSGASALPTLTRPASASTSPPGGEVGKGRPRGTPLHRHHAAAYPVRPHPPRKRVDLSPRERWSVQRQHPLLSMTCPHPASPTACAAAHVVTYRSLGSPPVRE